MIKLSEHFQVFVAGKIFIEGGVLTCQANACPECIGVFDNIKPGNLRASAIRLEERRQDTHRGGLAGTIGAENAKDASLLSHQIKPCQGVRLAVIFVQSFG